MRTEKTHSPLCRIFIFLQYSQPSYPHKVSREASYCWNKRWITNIVFWHFIVSWYQGYECLTWTVDESGVGDPGSSQHSSGWPLSATNQDNDNGTNDETNCESDKYDNQYICAKKSWYKCGCSLYKFYVNNTLVTFMKMLEYARVLNSDLYVQNIIIRMYAKIFKIGNII